VTRAAASAARARGASGGNRSASARAARARVTCCATSATRTDLPAAASHASHAGAAVAHATVRDASATRQIASTAQRCSVAPDSACVAAVARSGRVAAGAEQPAIPTEIGARASATRNVLDAAVGRNEQSIAIDGATKATDSESKQSAKQSGTKLLQCREHAQELLLSAFDFKCDAFGSTDSNENSHA